VDLGSVKTAPTPVLISGARAAATNAQRLLFDARVLAEAGCVPRAYSLAALAVEEAGKAGSLVLLTVMPEAVRSRAPVGRMLEWHQLKQVQGLIIARVPHRVPEVPSWFAAMPADELALFLSALDVLADDVDRLKRRGLYVDVGRGGRIREPLELTEGQVLAQLGQAERAASAVGQLLQPELQAWLADPPAEAVEFSRAVVRALTDARHAARTPDAAVKVVLNAVSMLRNRMAAEDTESLHSAPVASSPIRMP